MKQKEHKADMSPCPISTILVPKTCNMIAKFVLALDGPHLV